MAIDTLILGPVVFTDFSPPSLMPFGGQQAMVVHKLPGGSRVIDTLGPDDMDIRWHGRLWGDDAYSMALTLNALRRAGLPLPLIFGGQFYMVLISEFTCEIERLPLDCLYEITCVVTNINTFSALSSAALAAADLAAAALL